MEEFQASFLDASAENVAFMEHERLSSALRFALEDVLLEKLSTPFRALVLHLKSVPLSSHQVSLLSSQTTTTTTVLRILIDMTLPSFTQSLWVVVRKFVDHLEHLFGGDEKGDLTLQVFATNGKEYRLQDLPLPAVPSVPTWMLSSTENQALSSPLELDEGALGSQLSKQPQHNYITLMVSPHQTLKPLLEHDMWHLWVSDTAEVKALEATPSFCLSLNPDSMKITYLAGVVHSFMKKPTTINKRTMNKRGDILGLSLKSGKKPIPYFYAPLETDTLTCLDWTTYLPHELQMLHASLVIQSYLQVPVMDNLNMNYVVLVPHSLRSIECVLSCSEFGSRASQLLVPLGTDRMPHKALYSEVITSMLVTLRLMRQPSADDFLRANVYDVNSCEDYECREWFTKFLAIVYEMREDMKSPTWDKLRQQILTPESTLTLYWNQMNSRLLSCPKTDLLQTCTNGKNEYLGLAAQYAVEHKQEKVPFTLVANLERLFRLEKTKKGKRGESEDKRSSQPPLVCEVDLDAKQLYERGEMEIKHQLWKEAHITFRTYKNYFDQKRFARSRLADDYHLTYLMMTQHHLADSYEDVVSEFNAKSLTTNYQVMVKVQEGDPIGFFLPWQLSLQLPHTHDLASMANLWFGAQHLLEDHKLRSIWVSYTQRLEEVFYFLETQYESLNRLFGVTSRWTLEASKWNNVQAPLVALVTAFHSSLQHLTTCTTSDELVQWEVPVDNLRSQHLQKLAQEVALLEKDWKSWQSFAESFSLASFSLASPTSADLPDECVIMKVSDYPARVVPTYYEKRTPKRKDTYRIHYFTWKGQVWGFFLLLSSYKGDSCMTFCRNHAFVSFMTHLLYYSGGQSKSTTKSKTKTQIILDALRQVYSDLDALYFNERKESDGSGAAMVLVLYNVTTKDLYSSNVGDCETITVTKENQTRLLSTRHLVKDVVFGGHEDAERIFGNSKDIDLHRNYLQAKSTRDVLYMSHMLGCYPFKIHRSTKNHLYTKHAPRPMSPHVCSVVPFPALMEIKAKNLKKIVLCSSLANYSKETLTDSSYHLFSNLQFLTRSRLEIDLL